MLKLKLRAAFLILSFIFLFRLPATAGEEEFYNVINQLRIDYQAYFMGFDSSTRVRDACHAAALQQGLAVMTQAWAGAASEAAVIDPILDGLEAAFGGTPIAKVFDAASIIGAAMSGDPREFAEALAQQGIEELGSHAMGELLGGTTDQVEEWLQDVTGDQIANRSRDIYDRIREALRGMPNEVLEPYSPYGAQCGAEIYGTWYKSRGSVTLMVNGNCNCRRVGTSMGTVELERWSVIINGTTIPRRVNGHLVWDVNFKTARVYASCCSRGGNVRERDTGIFGPGAQIDRRQNDRRRTGTGSIDRSSSTGGSQPTTTGQTPTPPPPPAVDPHREAVARLNGHAAQMEAKERDCRSFEEEIARLRASLEENLRRQGELRDEIVQKEAELTRREERARQNVYEDNRTGQIYVGTAYGPNMIHKGWVIPQSRARELSRMRSEIESLRSELAALEGRGSELEQRLRQLLEELASCWRLAQSLRDQCRQTSGAIRGALSSGYSSQNARTALDRYDRSSANIEAGGNRLQSSATQVIEQYNQTWADTIDLVAKPGDSSLRIDSGKYITKDSNLPKNVQFANKDEEKKFISDWNDSLFIPVKKQIGIITSPKDSSHKDISPKETSQDQLTGPVIKKLLPPGASPGAMIFILGENFTKDRSKLKVFFGDREAKIIKSNEESIAVEVPGSITDCHVKVRVGEIESSGVAFKAGSGSGEAFITRGGESRVSRPDVTFSVEKVFLPVGEKTRGIFKVINTIKPMKVWFKNKNPDVASIKGGDEQTVTSSGGENNIYIIDITGIDGTRKYKIEFQIAE